MVWLPSQMTDSGTTGSIDALIPTSWQPALGEHVSSAQGPSCLRQANHRSAVAARPALTAGKGLPPKPQSPTPDNPLGLPDILPL